VAPGGRNRVLYYGLEGAGLDPENRRGRGPQHCLTMYRCSLRLSHVIPASLQCTASHDEVSA